jgi:uncharacterized protein (DUF885 family)
VITPTKSIFHNQILNSGNIPLKVLEDKIDQWIAAQKK